MIEIKVDDAAVVAKLDEMRAHFSDVRIAQVLTQAINRSLSWGRTQMSKDIRDDYNIKLARLYDGDKRKGLTIQKATKSSISGSISAGHRPVSFSAFNPRQTKQGVSVKIHKTETERIQSAFMIPGKGNLIFARGRYSAFGFLFRHRRLNTTGMDNPIDTLKSLSVATMVLHKKVREVWEPKIIEHFNVEAIRYMNVHIDQLRT